MRWLNRVIALSAAALVLLGAPAVPAIGQPVDVTVTIPAPAGAGATEISNAQFRWGINHEVGSAAFFGDCNFLSAGRAGDAGGSRVWTDADVGALFRSTDGAVRIEKPVGTQFHPMQWADRCTDAEGARLSTASMTGSGVQAVMDSGRGVVDLASGTATIEWTGSVSIVFYGGLTYWWFSDPVLTINADGTGNVTAVAGGFATSQEDSSRWEALPEARIVLAELSGATLTADGLATDPHYRGIEVSTPPGSVPQVREGPAWGSFPQSLIDYQVRTGQGAYWYSTGGARDAAKVATTLYISYDAAQPIPNAGNGVLSGGGGDDLPELTGGVLGGGALSGSGTGGAGNAAMNGTPAITSAAPLVGSSAGGLPAAGVAGIAPVGATTVLPGSGLIPGFRSAAEAARLLPWAVTLLLLLASVAWVGFRGKWLQLPWRTPASTTPQKSPATNPSSRG